MIYSAHRAPIRLLIVTFLCLICMVPPSDVLAQSVQRPLAADPATVTPTLQGKLNALLNAYDSVDQFNGSALIVENGKVLLDKGFGYSNVSDKSLNDEHTIFQIGSITKQFTAVVILKLVEQGKLQLSDRLSAWFPDFPKGDSITIHQLLTHTSGIYNYTNDANFMKIAVTQPADEQKMLSLFEYRQPDFPPGTQFNYSSSGYLLLGYIIQKITKQPYEQIVRKYIFTPLEMTHSGFDFKHLQGPGKATGYMSIRDENGIIAKSVDSSVSFSAGSMYTTTGDLLKWYEGLLAGKIIKRSSLEKAFTPHQHKYGYGWVIDTLYGKRVISHNGSILGFTSNMWWIGQDNICIILLNNIANPAIDKITNDLLAILSDKPYQLPAQRKEIPVATGALEKYVGAYELNPQFILRFFIEDGRLFVQKEGESEKHKLYAEKDNHFFLKEFEADLEFRVNEKGGSEQLILHQNGKDMPGNKIDSK